MMRRSLLLAALSLLSLSLAACSDLTAPAPSEPQVTTVKPTTGATTGGYGTSTGKK